MPKVNASSHSRAPWEELSSTHWVGKNSVFFLIHHCKMRTYWALGQNGMSFQSLPCHLLGCDFVNIMDLKYYFTGVLTSLTEIYKLRSLLIFISHYCSLCKLHVPCIFSYWVSYIFLLILKKFLCILHITTILVLFVTNFFLIFGFSN